MRRVLPSLVGLLLAAVFILPARAQQASNPFPTNSIEAKAALNATLQAIGSSSVTALQNRATLRRLAEELGKRYSALPTLEEIKRLLLALAPGVMPQLDLTDPDHAPLKRDLTGVQVAFGRQKALREANPDLQRVGEQTWPLDLTHGERVALQSYSGNSAGIMNQELRARGAVSPLYALVHDRLQSAFRKARPFNPPVLVSRGANVPNPGQLNALLTELKNAQKKGTPFKLIGYGSSTVGPKVLGGFMGNVHMHIKATHGLDVYPISLYPQEKEFLLNHASTYRVTSLNMEGGRWIVHLEQIPPKDDTKPAS